MRRHVLFALLVGAVGCEDDGDVIRAQGALRGPALVDFGDLPLGFEAIQAFELRNVGSGSVRLLGAEVVSEDDAHDLEIVTDVVDAQLAPNVPFEVSLSMQTLNVGDEPTESTLRINARIANDDPITLDVRVRARGVDRGLFARPNPVDFGTVRLGSALRKEVEVINLLSDPVDVFSAFSGTRAQLDDGDAFFQVVTPVDPTRDGSILEAGRLLRPGERTTVEIEYRPQATSIDELNAGAWTLRSCQDALCETTIELRGRGARNVLRCEPGEVDFGTVQPGLVRQVFVRCTNVSNVQLDVEGWELADFSSSEMAVEPPVDFPRRMEPGDSFEMEASFTGATVELGELSQGAIDIFARTVEDRAAANAEVPMRGTSGGPQILIDERLDFGSVLLERTGNASLTIANTGFADLEFERFEIVGPDAEVFTVLGGGPIALSQGEDRVIGFTFTPPQERSYAATLVVETNDPLRPRVDVPVTGEGVDLGPCQYAFEPESLAFGIIPAQGQAARIATFDNLGTEPCLLREARIEDDTDGVFGLVEPPFPSEIIAPGERRLLRVSFAPTDEDESDALFALQISGETDRIDLEGSGGLGDILSAPTVVDFGNIRLGCEARSQTVSITNVGNTGAEITQFDLRSREPDGVFSLSRLPGGLPPQNGNTRPINQGQTLDFVVSFRPVAPGTAVADIVIRLQNRAETYVIPLVGEASDEPFRVDRFRQSDTNRVDVLWVLDNSNSMDFALGLIEQTFNEIFEVLSSSDIDYQTALVTTDVVGSETAPCVLLDGTPSDGWLRGSCGLFSDGDDLVQRPDWKIVTSRTRPSPERAFQGLLDVPRGGAAVESGLEALRLALTPPRINGWNLGFLRTDADLAVIIISNEDDQGPRSVAFYANVVTALKGFANRRATINAIVPPIVCIPGSEEAGRCIAIGPQRYAEAALRTGGILENIGVDGDAAPDEQARQFGEKLFNVVLGSTSLRALFPLSEVPAPGTLQILVDGGPLDSVSPSGAINWTYEPIGNRVRFTDRGRPPPGSDVEIRYQTFCF